MPHYVLARLHGLPSESRPQWLLCACTHDHDSIPSLLPTMGRPRFAPRVTLGLAIPVISCSSMRPSQCRTQIHTISHQHGGTTGPPISHIAPAVVPPTLPRRTCRPHLHTIPTHLHTPPLSTLPSPPTNPARIAVQPHHPPQAPRLMAASASAATTPSRSRSPSSSSSCPSFSRPSASHAAASAPRSAAARQSTVAPAPVRPPNLSTLPTPAAPAPLLCQAPPPSTSPHASSPHT